MGQSLTANHVHQYPGPGESFGVTRDRWGLPVEGNVKHTEAYNQWNSFHKFEEDL